MPRLFIPWISTLAVVIFWGWIALQIAGSQHTQARAGENSLQFLEFGAPYIFKRAIWCHRAWHAVALLHVRQVHGVDAYTNLRNELFTSFSEEGGRTHCYSVDEQRAYAREPVARVDGLYVYKMYLPTGEVIYSIGSLPVLDPKYERGA